MFAIEKNKAAAGYSTVGIGNTTLQGILGQNPVAILLYRAGQAVDSDAVYSSVLERETLETLFGGILSNVAGIEQKPCAEGFARKHLSDFMEHLKGNKSSKTAQGYFYDARNVLTEISQKNFNGRDLSEVSLSEITKEYVTKAEYAFFNESSARPKTLNRLKQGWNCFCSFIGMPDWFFTSHTNAAREYRDDVINNEDVVKMLEYCREQSKNTESEAERIRWLRMEIAILLGWTLGFRSCEYGNATFDEILNKGYITIQHSKHNSTRVVVVTDEVEKAVSELKELLVKSNKYPQNGGVFEKPDGKNYSTSTFRRWLKKAGAACDISTELAKTHGLRHRFAKNFYNYKPDEFMLADILGHKSVETTRHYAAPTREDMRKAMQETSNKARSKI